MLLHTNVGWPEIQDVFSLKRGGASAAQEKKSTVLFSLAHITKGLQHHCTRAPSVITTHTFPPLECTIGE